MKLLKTDELMRSYISQKYCDSYAILVYRNGKKSLITSENVDEDTYFDIASCGKVMVTSTLILKAIGEGKLSLEDTLDKFFESVPEEKRKITIKQLLTHTSGIIRYEISAETAQNGHDAVAAYILEKPLAYQPGEDYIYSCNGFILLGFILEKIYGISLAEIFEQNLKKPLGMTVPSLKKIRFYIRKKYLNWQKTTILRNVHWEEVLDIGLRMKGHRIRPLCLQKAVSVIMVPPELIL